MKKIRFLILFLLMLQIPQINVNAVSLKQGISCQKVGQILRSGKNIFICEAALSGKVLIKQQALSSNAKLLALDAESVISELSSLDTTRIINLVISETQLKEQSITLETRINEIPILITTAKNTKVQFESEISLLPARINQAKIIMEQSKAALILPEQKYFSLTSQLNSMSYEYDSAIRAQSASVACRVLKDFGFSSGCGSYNSYSDVVISRYNSLKFQVNAAQATYDSYFSTYYLHSQQYNGLASSQPQLTIKIFDEQRKITEFSQELTAKKLELKKSQDVSAILAKLKNNQTALIEAPRKLSESISLVISQSSKTWSKQLSSLFRKSALIQYDFSLIPIIQPTSTSTTPSTNTVPTPTPLPTPSN